MVPMSTKDDWARVRPRNFVMRPMEITPTIGQKSSSKKKKTLRDAMRALRTTTAHTASTSARQLNEHLLELGLAHTYVADGPSFGEELAEQIRQALLGVVHGALRPAVLAGTAQHPRCLGEPRRRRRLHAQRDDVPEAEAAFELRGGAGVEDAAGLDEGHLVTQLLGLAHVVGGQHDGHAALASQRAD